MSTKEKKASSMKARRRAGNIAAYIVLILMSIIWLFPFFGILMQSFRSYATEYGGVVSYIIPKQFSEIYKQYNELQLSCGYDLSGFCGMEATVYTYEIQNYKN